MGLCGPKKICNENCHSNIKPNKYAYTVDIDVAANNSAAYSQI